MIHRDFKPQNILIGSRDHAYLADFGLTQALGQPGLTRTGQFVGTLDYIAPEQIHGKPATRRSDVYAFGAVLFECLTGKRPLPARVRRRDPVRPRQRAAAAPERDPPRLARPASTTCSTTRWLRTPTQRMDSATRGDRRAGRRDRRQSTRLPPPPPPLTVALPAASSADRRAQAVARASTTFGAPSHTRATSKTIIDRPPSAIPGRPATRSSSSSYRKPILITLAAILLVARGVERRARALRSQPLPRRPPSRLTLTYL